MVNDVANTEEVITTEETTTVDENSSSIAELLTKIIDAFVAIVDGFVTVLQENAQAIAEITVIGIMIGGAVKLFGSALGGLKGIVGM